MTKTNRINLTDNRIKALAPDPTGKRRPELRDAIVPGLIVVAGKNGRKTFALHGRFPGSRNPTRRRIGEVGALSIEQARETARDWLLLVKRGVDPALEKAAREEESRRVREAATFANERLFKNAAETYIARKVTRQRQADYVTRIIRNVLIDSWGDKPVTEITRRDVVKLVEEVADRPAPVYASACFGVARTMFGWFVDRGTFGLETNVCASIRINSLLGDVKKRGKRVLSDDELVAFWKATGRLGYPWQPLFRLLLLTGTRRSEAAEASWNEFAGDRTLWTVPPERFKSDTTHPIPLSEDAQAILGSLPRFRRGNFLFSHSFGETPPQKFAGAKEKLDGLMLRYLRAMARLRGEDPLRPALPSWVIHDLRRTVRTRMSALGIDYVVAELCIGHTLKGLHATYDQYTYAKEMRAAFDLWARELQRIVRRERAASNVVPLRAGEAK